MKHTRGVALFWAIAALAGMAAVYMFVSIMGQMPPISKDGYVSKILPVERDWFWFITVPFVAFSIGYFTELVKNDYENLVKNIWGHVATGALVGIFALIMSVHQLISANHLPALLVFELALMVFAPIFTIDDLKVVIIATSSNMILVLYYVVFITPFKAEGLFFLPGIAVTLLILNMIIYSFWAFALSILERIFSKEFWKSATIGLRQTIQQ